MSAFSVENPQDGKTFENYTRFEWGVEVGVVTTFMLRLFVPHEFDMLTYKQVRLFQTVDDGKLNPPHLKGNINSPIKFINCAMFPDNETGKIFITFHHREIPRRNSICNVTA